MKNKFNLSGFWLKLFGLITMTFDHIGVFMEMYYVRPDIALIFRSIGRLAFPIFIFLIVEGVEHTHNIKKYLLRLAILASVIAIPDIIIVNFIDSSLDMSSPIIDLVVIALAIALLNRRDKWSFFSLIPIAYSVACFVVEYVEHTQHLSVDFLPYFIRMDYTFFGMALALGYFFSKDLAKIAMLCKDETKDLLETPYFQLARNIFSALTVLIVSLVFTIAMNTLYNFEYGYYAMLAAAPILLYSGKRGYNSKWFQYACYVYFPAHLVIIFAIFYFVLGVSL